MSWDIDTLFELRENQRHSINEHMWVLRSYAAECEHVTEFGTEMGFSTTAFVDARPKRVICYDITENAALKELLAVIPPEVKFTFHRVDCREADIEETDLLFIDTFHNYRQLRAELEKHGNKASKYIILHDTETYGRIDEHPDGGPQGLLLAMHEFLDTNPHWSVFAHYPHQHGLTVLMRTG